MAIKLVESRHDEYGKYAALSYCWGSVLTCRTTSGNLSERLQGIPWASLPPTFRDAIRYCVKLQIPYIWIDALCIIQDDEADWQVESAKMAEVYQNAHITLAATSAASTLGGCFPETLGPREKDERRFEFGGLADGQPSSLWVRRKLHHWNDPRSSMVQDDEYPLLRRGWAFQERVLSPRLLYFCRQELVWECAGESCCECGGLVDWALKRRFTITKKPGDTQETSLHNPEYHAWYPRLFGKMERERLRKLVDEARAKVFDARKGYTFARRQVLIVKGFRLTELPESSSTRDQEQNVQQKKLAYAGLDLMRAELMSALIEVRLAELNYAEIDLAAKCREAEAGGTLWEFNPRLQLRVRRHRVHSVLYEAARHKAELRRAEARLRGVQLGDGRQDIVLEAELGLRSARSRFFTALKEKILRMPRGGLDEAITQWHNIVGEYSSCTLTKGADRLPALSGLAHRVEPFLGNYLAGLWEKSLVLNLTWRVEQLTPGLQRPQGYRGPSWSWVSVKPGVAFWTESEMSSTAVFAHLVDRWREQPDTEATDPASSSANDDTDMRDDQAVGSTDWAGVMAVTIRNMSWQVVRGGRNVYGEVSSAVLFADGMMRTAKLHALGDPSEAPNPPIQSDLEKILSQTQTTALPNPFISPGFEVEIELSSWLTDSPVHSQRLLFYADYDLTHDGPNKLSTTEVFILLLFQDVGLVLTETPMRLGEGFVYRRIGILRVPREYEEVYGMELQTKAKRTRVAII